MTPISPSAYQACQWSMQCAALSQNYGLGVFYRNPNEPGLAFRILAALQTAETFAASNCAQLSLVKWRPKRWADLKLTIGTFVLKVVFCGVISKIEDKLLLDHSKCSNEPNCRVAQRLLYLVTAVALAALGILTKLGFEIRPDPAICIAGFCCLKLMHAMIQRSPGKGWPPANEEFANRFLIALPITLSFMTRDRGEIAKCLFVAALNTEFVKSYAEEFDQEYVQPLSDAVKRWSEKIGDE